MRIYKKNIKTRSIYTINRLGNTTKLYPRWEKNNLL